MPLKWVQNDVVNGSWKEEGIKNKRARLFTVNVMFIFYEKF